MNTEPVGLKAAAKGQISSLGIIEYYRFVTTLQDYMWSYLLFRE